jgi:ABC-2 type transport system permease protein
MNWDQLQAIVWLRWRLSWNRFVRAGSLNAVISIIILAGLTTGAVAAGVGGVLLGTFVAAKQSAQVLLIIWDGVVIVFLIFWLAGLLAEIQRAESIDLAKLMHLPLTLEQVFVFNYLASHFTPGIILLLPGMLGLAIGLAIGGGLRMALMIPLIVSFLFMLTAWTYCLRGWLSALMVNKRRRRAIVVWITLGFVLIFQLPGIIINSTMTHKRGARPKGAGSEASQSASPGQNPSAGLSDGIVRAHLAVPLGWPGYSAMSLQQNRPWPFVGATAASCLLGALGLMRSYRSTLRFYQGAEAGASTWRSTRTTSVRPRRVPLVERTLPWLPDNTAALALAMLQSLLRAPEMKMSLIMPIVAGAAFSSVSGLKHSLPEQFRGFIAPVAALLAAFSFAPIMANAFGLDRNGFRGLVLLPTGRDQILLAKNLAFLPFVGGVGMALLVLAKFLLRISSEAFITGLAEIVTAFILFSLMCNVISILAPYRTAAGTLQAKKPKPVVFLAVGITMLGMPVILWPVFVPPILQLLCTFVSGVPRWLPVNVLASLVLLCGVAWLYWLLLPAQGRLLQRREQRILVEVTEDVE